MKKIMTLLAMFLMFGGILMAQTPQTEEVWVPKFSYQVVLRDANNQLVANKSGNVVVKVNDVPLEVAGGGAFTTNRNGLASLVLSDRTRDINWADATIVATFTLDDEEEEITVETPVTAVPFAMQAADAELSTGTIVNYLDPSFTNGDDVAAVYGALRGNSSFHDAFRDTIVNYVMTNYSIAKEIAFHYLDVVTPHDLWELYDTARNVDESTKEAVYRYVKKYLKDHRELLLQVAEYCIEHTTQAELESLYNEMLANTAVSAKMQEYLFEYFDRYLRENRYLGCGLTLCQVADLVGQSTEASDCPTGAIEGVEVTNGDNANSRICTFNNNAGYSPIYNPQFEIMYMVGSEVGSIEVSAGDPIDGVYSIVFDLTTLPTGCTFAQVGFKFDLRCKESGATAPQVHTFTSSEYTTLFE